MNKEITLYAFYMHGMINPGQELLERNADYSRLIKGMTSATGLAFADSKEDRLVLIESVDRIHDQETELLRVKFIEINRDNALEIFDIRSEDSEEITLPDDHALIIGVTYAFFMEGAREVLLQNPTRGVTKRKIENFLTRLLQQQCERSEIPRLTLTPIPGKQLIEAIESFDRIRVAEVRLSRPNKSWSNTACSLIGAAEESNPRIISIGATAERGASLPQDRGIIDSIKSLARERSPEIDNLKITGTPANSNTEENLSLKEHQERQSFVTDATKTVKQIHHLLGKQIASYFRNVLNRKSHSRESHEQ